MHWRRNNHASLATRKNSKLANSAERALRRFQRGALSATWLGALSTHTANQLTTTAITEKTSGDRRAHKLHQEVSSATANSVRGGRKIYHCVQTPLRYSRRLRKVLFAAERETVIAQDVGDVDHRAYPSAFRFFLVAFRSQVHRLPIRPNLPCPSPYGHGLELLAFG